MAGKVLPKGVRHRIHEDQAAHATVRVPLFTANPAGEYKEGYFRVPVKYAEAKVHSNERHEFERIYRQKVQAWAAWWGSQDWDFVPDSLELVGFSPVRMETATEEQEPEYECHIKARFRLTIPLRMGFDDLHEQVRDADRYHVDLRDEKLPDSAAMGVKAEDLESGDALQAADKRREKHNLKRVLKVEDGQAKGADIVSTD